VSVEEWSACSREEQQREGSMGRGKDANVELPPCRTKEGCQRAAAMGRGAEHREEGNKGRGVGHGWNLCHGKAASNSSNGENPPSTMDPRGMKVLLSCALWSLGREAYMEASAPTQGKPGRRAPWRGASAPCCVEEFGRKKWLWRLEKWRGGSGKFPICKGRHFYL
jgi:hypothetical protein